MGEKTSNSPLSFAELEAEFKRTGRVEPERFLGTLKDYVSLGASIGDVAADILRQVTPLMATEQLEAIKQIALAGAMKQTEAISQEPGKEKALLPLKDVFDYVRVAQIANNDLAKRQTKAG